MADPDVSPTNDPPVNPPPNPPVSEPTNSPPSNPPQSDTNTRMDRLESILTSLTETVAKLIPSDDKPTRRPWTHPRRNQD